MQSVNFLQEKQGQMVDFSSGEGGPLEKNVYTLKTPCVAVFLTVVLVSHFFPIDDLAEALPRDKSLKCP